MLNLSESRLEDYDLVNEWMAHDTLPSETGYTLDDADMALLSQPSRSSKIIDATYEAGEPAY